MPFNALHEQIRHNLCVQMLTTHTKVSAALLQLAHLSACWGMKQMQWCNAYRVLLLLGQGELQH